MLRKILRNFSDSCPKDALTGDSILDEFLVQLDKKLIGGQKVRLLSLLEIKDHLLNKKNEFMKKGQSESAAAKESIDSMKGLELFTDQQNRSLIKRGVQTGLFTSLLVFLIHHYSHYLLYSSPNVSLWQSIFVGLFTGAFLAVFNIVLPTKKLPQKDYTPGIFTVKTSRGYLLNIILGISFFLVMFVNCIGSFLSLDYLNILKISKLGAIIYAPVCLLFPFLFYSAFRSYSIDNEGVLVKGLLTRKKILWKNVVGIGTLGELKAWIPKWSNWSREVVLKYRHENNESKRICLDQNMINLDRFIFTVNQIVK